MIFDGFLVFDDWKLISLKGCVVGFLDPISDGLSLRKDFLLVLQKDIEENVEMLENFV